MEPKDIPTNTTTPANMPMADRKEEKHFLTTPLTYNSLYELDKRADERYYTIQCAVNTSVVQTPSFKRALELLVPDMICFYLIMSQCIEINDKAQREAVQRCHNLVSLLLYTTDRHAGQEFKIDYIQDILTEPTHLSRVHLARIKWSHLRVRPYVDSAPFWK